MSEFRLLIVDDSRYIARLIQMKLEKLNWKVFTEHNPRTLLRTVQKVKPDLILLDVVLPNANGFVLCAAMRKLPPPLNKIPIIIHSAKATRSDVLLARKAGANNYIIKPATVPTIVQKVEMEMQRGGRSVLGGAANMDKVVTSIFTPNMSNDDRMAALIKASGDIKAMPQAVHRTLKVTNDQKTGAGELAHVITSDSAISAMVLKKANTAHFGKSEPIVNIQEAIVRIGFSETKNLVLGLSVINNFDKERKSLGFSRLSFWEHSLAVGIFAKHIALQSKVCDSHYAFVAGLLHDIGKMVLDEYATDDFDQALEVANRKRIPIGAAERETYVITHNEVGQSLLEKWQFPPVIQKVAMYHNNIAEAEATVIPEDLVLVKLIAVANAMAKAYRFGNGGDQILEECSIELAEWAGLKEGLSDDLIGKVNQEIEDFKEFIKMPPEGGVDESTLAPKDIPSRVYYFREPRRPVDHVRNYLLRSDYELVECTPAEAAQTIANGEPGVMVWNAENDLDLEAIGPTLTDMPGETPVMILMRKKFAIAWNDAPERKNTIAIPKPLCGHLLVQRVIENQRAIFGGGDEEAAEAAQSAD